MSEELKTCPFCSDGGKPYRISRSSDMTGTTVAIQCRVCGVQSRWFRNESEAIAAWNKRAPLPSDPPNMAGKGILEEMSVAAQRAFDFLTMPAHEYSKKYALSSIHNQQKRVADILEDVLARRLALSGNAGGEDL